MAASSVLVTGGSRGLGLAIAERLAGDGARVGLIARGAEALERAAGGIVDQGGQARPFPADVTDRPALSAAVDAFADWAGGIDHLVCAAGQLAAVGPLAQVDPDDWWRDVETALRGFQLSARTALPWLARSDRGTITVLVGPGHNAAFPFATGYAAAQAGLVRTVENLARELEGPVRVFAVNPGLVLSGLVRPWIESAEGRRWLPRFNQALAEGKEVGPEVVAAMVSWLIGHRPEELHGRVVAAGLAPEFLEARLPRVVSADLGVLRLR